MLCLAVGDPSQEVFLSANTGKIHAYKQLAFVVSASIYVTSTCFSVVASGTNNKNKGKNNIKIQFVFTVTLTMKLETDNPFLKTTYFSDGKAVSHSIIL